jgi:hypothetical protein
MFYPGAFRTTRENQILQDANKLNYNIRKQVKKNYTDMDGNEENVRSPDHEDIYTTHSNENSPNRKKKAVRLVNDLTSRLQTALDNQETSLAGDIIQQLQELNSVSDSHSQKDQNPQGILKKSSTSERVEYDDESSYYDQQANDAREDHQQYKSRNQKDIRNFIQSNQKTNRKKLFEIFTHMSTHAMMTSLLMMKKASVTTPGRH